MKTFEFKLYIRTKQGHEFVVSRSEIVAQNVDGALKQFNRMELPFHHFTTITAKPKSNF